MKYISFYLILIILVSCNKLAFDNHAKMNQLADRTCKAITYRKLRFSVADSMRFAQDTLMQTKSKADSDRLNKRLAGLLKQKALLLKESLSLSDTIRLQLDSLMPYTDKEAQKRFTAELDSLLAKKGCKE